MGRRQQRRKPTRREKIGRSEGKNVRRSGDRGIRREFSDLSPMTQEIVVGIAARQRCTREEIVEVLNG